MKYRNLGDSGLRVSAICLGTWVFGGDCWGEVDDGLSMRVVEEAIEAGVNFIDTAPIYGAGRSEYVIGRAIKGKRDRPVIATKFGLRKKGKGIGVDLSAGFIREEAENSLRRLGLDAIDLYQCHWPSDTTPYRETFGELNGLLKEGKIKNVGVSNFSAEQTRKAMEYSPVLTNQVQYSLLDRRVEQDVMPFCERNGVFILPYGVLGGGILSGKYKEPPEVKDGDVKDFFYRFYKEPEWSGAMRVVSALGEIAARHGAPVSHAAMNWALSRTAVPSCIAGCRTPEQLRENVKAVEWELTSEEVERLDKEYAEIFGPEKET